MDDQNAGKELEDLIVFQPESPSIYQYFSNDFNCMPLENEGLVVDINNNASSSHKTKVTCTLCKRVLNAGNLNHHMRLKHEPRRFICDFCGKNFASKGNLRLHMQQHRSSVITCKACGKTFKCRQSMRYHLRRHFEHFYCDVCNLRFAHKKLYLAHVATFHDPALKAHCHYCTRSFARADLRDAHERIAHKEGQVGSQYKCNVCCEAFDWRDDLIRHNLISHYQGMLYSCTKCEKIFKRPNLLQLHMTVHKDESAKRKYSCEICHKKFAYKTGLHKHKKHNRCDTKNVMEGLLPLDQIEDIAKQQLREMSFYQYSDTSKKIRAKRINKEKEGISPKIENLKEDKLLDTSVYDEALEASSYASNMEFLSKTLNDDVHVDTWFHQSLRSELACKFCEQEFLSKDILDAHITIHDTFKPYECSECPKKFKRKCELQNHKKSIHALVKMYIECNVCKKLILEKNLKSHKINQHSAVANHKPFECDLCGKRERYLKILKRHLENSHLKLPRNNICYACGECSAVFTRKNELKKHSFVHYDGELFCCEVCGTLFKHKSQLMSHKSSHQLFSYICSACNRCFKSKSGLFNHQKLHKLEIFEN